jgi:hypothetical protein
VVRLSLAVAVLTLAAGPTEALAQYCIGSTVYTVRDTKGDPMGPSELARVEVVSINGQRARRQGAGKAVFYEAGRYKIRPGRPLVLATLDQCGLIDELVLRYRGRVMRLRFGVVNHNTRYHIEALPFQSGTFLLTDESRGSRIFPCAGGAGPPRIDNETVGECLVPARLWKRVPSSKARAPGSLPAPTRSGP